MLSGKHISFIIALYFKWNDLICAVNGIKSTVDLIITGEKGYFCRKRPNWLRRFWIERSVLSHESVTILIPCEQNLRNLFTHSELLSTEQNKNSFFSRRWEKKRIKTTKNKNKNGHLISIYLKVDINRKEKLIGFWADSPFFEWISLLRYPRKVFTVTICLWN